MEMERGQIKFLLVGINAKYIHSNLAIYDLKAYAGKQEGRFQEGILLLCPSLGYFNVSGAKE